MPLKQELCFVQFIHPGKEHQPDHCNVKEWNQKDHRRKFLEIKGRCRRGGRESQGALRFWAEWEPQSEVIAEIAEPVLDGPGFVCRPFYVIPRSYRRLQNTDPFVFGSFFYTGCQQHTKRGPTQLRLLERGSVILFGSWVWGFVLDTVFVVDSWVDHNSEDYAEVLRGKVPAAYWEVTIRAWYESTAAEVPCSSSHSPRSYRLYRGATVDNPVDGMFSFFPCMLAASCPRGFARPVIKEPGVIEGSLRQGKRLNRGMSQHDVRQHWENVRKQVESAELSLGVHADVPDRRSTSP